MRQLRYNAATTLDGFIASPDGTTDWIIEDPSIDFDALYDGFDYFVMGRKTYEVMKSFGEQNPLATRSKECVFVVSRTLKHEDCSQVTVLSEGFIELVRDLKRGEGKDIWFMGGGELARLFFEAGLIDYVEAAVMPVLLGSGIQFITAGSNDKPAPYKLELKEVESLKSGILLTKYQVLGNS